MAVVSSSENERPSASTNNNNRNTMTVVHDEQTMISFTIEGKPIPLARPRFTMARRNGVYMQNAPARSEFRRDLDALCVDNNLRMLSVDSKLSITIIYIFHYRGRNRDNGVVPCRVTRGQPTAGGDLGDYEASAMNEHHDKSHQSTMRAKHEGSDGNHIPPHGPKGAGSKDSKANPEWQVVN